MPVPDATIAARPSARVRQACGAVVRDMPSTQAPASVPSVERALRSARRVTLPTPGTRRIPEDDPRHAPARLRRVRRAGTGSGRFADVCSSRSVFLQHLPQLRQAPEYVNPRGVLRAIEHGRDLTTG